jgi:hypothetical protein
VQSRKAVLGKSDIPVTGLLRVAVVPMAEALAATIIFDLHTVQGCWVDMCALREGGGVKRGLADWDYR